MAKNYSNNNQNSTNNGMNANNMKNGGMQNQTNSTNSDTMLHSQIHRLQKIHRKIQMQITVKTVRIIKMLPMSMNIKSYRK